MGDCKKLNKLNLKMFIDPKSYLVAQKIQLSLMMAHDYFYDRPLFRDIITIQKSKKYRVFFRKKVI